MFGGDNSETNQSCRWVIAPQLHVFLCSQFVLRDGGVQFHCVSGGRKQRCAGACSQLTPWPFDIFIKSVRRSKNRAEEEQGDLSCLCWLHTVEHIYLIFLSLSCLASNAWQMWWCLWVRCGLLQKWIFFFFTFLLKLVLFMQKCIYSIQEKRLSQLLFR